MERSLSQPDRPVHVPVVPGHDVDIEVDGAGQVVLVSDPERDDGRGSLGVVVAELNLGQIHSLEHPQPPVADLSTATGAERGGTVESRPLTLRWDRLAALMVNAVLWAALIGLFMLAWRVL